MRFLLTLLGVCGLLYWGVGVDLARHSMGEQP